MHKHQHITHRQTSASISIDQNDLEVLRNLCGAKDDSYEVFNTNRFEPTIEFSVTVETYNDPHGNFCQRHIMLVWVHTGDYGYWEYLPDGSWRNSEDESEEADEDEVDEYDEERVDRMVKFLRQKWLEYENGERAYPLSEVESEQLLKQHFTDAQSSEIADAITNN